MSSSGSGRKREERTQSHRSKHSKRSRSRSPRRSVKRDSKKSSHHDSSVQSSTATQDKNEEEFKNMTPAERLKAKVKVLLDKTTPTETTPKSQPNPVQVLEIEAEEFAPQSFTSKRKNKTNQKEDAKSDSSLGCHDKAIFGEIKKDNEETDIISLNLPITAKRIELPVLSDAEVSSLSQEKALKWGQKLKALRHKYISDNNNNNNN